MNSLFVSSKFGVYETDENKQLIRDLKQDCEVWNPQFLYLQKKDKFTGNTERKLKYYKYTTDKEGRGLYLFPRNTAQVAIDKCREVSYFLNKGWAGFPEITPKFKLWDYQEKVVSEFVNTLKGIKTGCGLLKGPCGSGKTIMGSEVIRRLGVRFLVLVDQNMLGDQWLMAFEDYLGLTEGQYVFRDKTKRCAKAMMDSFIDVCTIQSLMPGRSEMTPEQKKKYGGVIVDECHIVPGDVISKVVSGFSSYYSLGTTATDHRKDGRTKIISMFVGDTLAAAEVKQLSPVVIVTRVPQIIPDQSSIMAPVRPTMTKKDIYYTIKETSKAHASSRFILDGVREYLGQCGPVSEDMIRDLAEYIKQQLYLCSWWSSKDKDGNEIDGTVDMLCKDENRNRLILRNVVKDYNDGRHQLVLSPFIYHCEFLAKSLQEKGIDLRILTGKIKRKDRIQIIRDFKAEKFRVIVATFPLVKKGLDVPILDSLHLLHPFKINSPEEPGDLEQAIGRILRKKDKPLDPLAKLHAYFDKGGGPEALFWKHWKYYQHKGWRINWQD